MSESDNISKPQSLGRRICEEKLSEKMKEINELKQEIERLKNHLLDDWLAFDAIHELHPELGLNERADYIKSILTS